MLMSFFNKLILMLFPPWSILTFGQKRVGNVQDGSDFQQQIQPIIKVHNWCINIKEKKKMKKKRGYETPNRIAAAI